MRLTPLFIAALAGACLHFFLGAALVLALCMAIFVVVSVELHQMKAPDPKGRRHRPTFIRRVK